MVPAHLSFCPMPINHNGKLDRHALPDPDESGQGERGDFLRRPTRRGCRGCGVAVGAGAGMVDIHDSYFELGGDAERSGGQSTPPRRLAGGYAKVFLYPTIAELARQLQAEETNADQSAVRVRFAANQRWFCRASR